jgi:hypothetical protein
VAWFAGMIDQAAWMRKPHEGFRSEHMEHVTKKLALAAAKRTVGRPLAGHLERHPIGGATAPICGASGHVVDGHQPQAGLTVGWECCTGRRRCRWRQGSPQP